MRQERHAKVYRADPEELNCEFLATMFDLGEFTHIVAVDKANHYLIMDVDPELRTPVSESKMYYRSIPELLEDYRTLKKSY